MFGQTLQRTIIFAACACALAYLLFVVIGVPAVELTRDIQAENGAFYTGFGYLIAQQLYGTTRFFENVRVTSTYVLWIFLVSFFIHQVGGTASFQWTSFPRIEDAVVYSSLGFFAMLHVISMQKARLLKQAGASASSGAAKQ